jgi:hypothetical protein
VPFNGNENALHDYLLTNDETIWDAYWEDPEPETE